MNHKNTTPKTEPRPGIYRHGRVYFRAAWIKSRKHYRFYWLTPGGDVPSSKRYAELPAGARKLKRRPSRQQLTDAQAVRT